MIFCEECGFAYSGCLNHENRRYRHAHGRGSKKIYEHPKGLIDSEVVEDMVMRHLFECFGNPKAMETAIEKAMPNLEKIKQHQERIKRNEQSLKKVDTHRQTIMNRERKGIITEAEALKQLQETAKDRVRLETEITRLTEYLTGTPDPTKIKSMAQSVTKKFKGSTFNVKRRAIAQRVNTDFTGMTYEQKRELCERVFSGERPDGSRMGVYIKWDKKGNWTFSIHGHLIEEQDLKPMSDEGKEAFWGDFQDNSAHLQRGVTKSPCHLQGRCPPVRRFR